MSQHISTTVSPTDDVATVVEAAAQAMNDVEYNTPGCVGRTMELLWESLFCAEIAELGSNRICRRSAQRIPPKNSPNSSGRQERSTFRCRRRGAASAIDEHRIEVLTVTADYDVILCPAMPTPAKPHHHGLVEINDFSHVMVHNLTGWPAAVGVQIVARPLQDSTALAVAGFLVKVFGGWRRPPPVAA